MPITLRSIAGLNQRHVISDMHSPSKYFAVCSRGSWIDVCIEFRDHISLMQQQFVVIHLFTLLQQTYSYKSGRSSTDQHLCTLCFYGNIREAIFCGHNILTDSVFVTQPSSNAGITFWRIVWVTTTCRFMSVIVSELFVLRYITVNQN